MEWSNADRFQDRDDDAREIPQEFLGTIASRTPSRVAAPNLHTRAKQRC